MTDALTTPPPSPCNGICAIDDNGNCKGCARTLEEIAAWPAMSAVEQRALIEKLALRRRETER